MDTLKAQIAGRNDGMLSTYRSSNQSFKVMMEYKVRIEGNTVTRDGEPMFAIHRRHSAKKVQGLSLIHIYQQRQPDGGIGECQNRR